MLGRALRTRPEYGLADLRASAGRLLRSRTARQAALNAFSTGLTSLLSAVATALVARHLTTDRFGAFQFATSLLLFVAIFFEFGLALPAARIAARSKKEERPGVVGAALAVSAPVCVAFAVVVFALSFATDSIFHVRAGGALRATAALAVVYPFQLFALQIAQGADRLHVASITNALANALFVVALVVAAVETRLSVTLALALRGAALLVGAIMLILWLRPGAVGLGRRVRHIVGDARTYGFQMYLGRIFSIGTYNMDVLMLGALTNARDVGLYTLAGALARVTQLPVVGATSALFPRMAREPRIDVRWLRLAGAAGVAGVLVLGLAGGFLIDLLFSSRYTGASNYLIPLTLAEACRGVTLVYNTYLSAQAQGRALRDAGLILTGSNLVLNFALIPTFGATGAAWASFAALVANLAAHVVYYRRALPPAGEPGHAIA